MAHIVCVLEGVEVCRAMWISTEKENVLTKFNKSLFWYIKVDVIKVDSIYSK